MLPTREEVREAKKYFQDCREKDYIVEDDLPFLESLLDLALAYENEELVLRQDRVDELIQSGKCVSRSQAKRKIIQDDALLNRVPKQGENK